MAKRNNDVPEVEISLPADAGKSKELVALYVSDMRLTWSEYFKKHNQFLYKYVSSPRASNKHFVLADKRIPTERKSWTMNSSVKAFVDGFLRNRKRYTAILKLEVKNRNLNQNSSTRSHQTPAASSVTVDSTTPPRSGGNRQNARPTVSSTTPSPTNRKRGAPTSETSATAPKTCNVGEAEVNLNLRAQSGSSSTTTEVMNEEALRGMMPPPPVPPRPSGGRRILIPDDDDTASMANTIDSQESRDEMIANGIDIRQIKSEVVTNMVKHVNNNDMLKIQNELRKVYESGRWMKVASNIPLSAHFLQLLFKPQN